MSTALSLWVSRGFSGAAALAGMVTSDWVIPMATDWEEDAGADLAWSGPVRALKKLNMSFGSLADTDG